MYLPYQELLGKYPLGDIIGKGSRAMVYQSGDYAVKVARTKCDEHTFTECIRELNIYSQIQHPCIPKLIAWSIDINEPMVYYLVLPMGQKINSQQLTFEELVGDLISAAIQLESIGFCHNDMKTDNVIYQDGYAQLIDFGIVGHICEYQQGWYIEQPRYTLTYRDPECYYNNKKDTAIPVSNKVELFSIGVIALRVYYKYNIYKHTEYPASSSNYQVDKCHQDILDDLFRFPIHLRLSFQQMMNKYPQLRRSDSTFNTSKSQMSHPPFYNIEQIILYMSKLDNSTKSLFNAIHLNYQLCSSELSLSYYCMVISQMMLDQRLYIFSDLEVLTGLNSQKVRTDILNTVIQLNGIICPLTGWDHAGSYEDLPKYLYDMINGTYQPETKYPYLEPMNHKNQSCCFLPAKLLDNAIVTTRRPPFFEHQPPEIVPLTTGEIQRKIEIFLNKINKSSDEDEKIYFFYTIISYSILYQYNPIEQLTERYCDVPITRYIETYFRNKTAIG